MDILTAKCPEYMSMDCPLVAAPKLSPAWKISPLKNILLFNEFFGTLQSCSWVHFRKCSLLNGETVLVILIQRNEILSRINVLKN